MQKFKVGLGKDLKNCEIRYSETVPVTQNFDNTKVLGFAEIMIENHDIMAEMDIELPPDHFLYAFAPSGVVLRQQGPEITSFHLQSISLVARTDIDHTSHYSIYHP